MLAYDLTASADVLHWNLHARPSLARGAEDKECTVCKATLMKPQVADLGLGTQPLHKTDRDIRLRTSLAANGTELPRYGVNISRLSIHKAYSNQPVQIKGHRRRRLTFIVIQVPVKQMGSRHGQIASFVC